MELHDFRFYLEELHGQPISAKVLLKSSGKLKLGFFLRHLSYYIILNCHVEDITQPDVITGEGRTWLEIVRKTFHFLGQKQSNKNSILPWTRRKKNSIYWRQKKFSMSQINVVLAGMRRRKFQRQKALSPQTATNWIHK